MSSRFLALMFIGYIMIAMIPIGAGLFVILDSSIPISNRIAGSFIFFALSTPLFYLSHIYHKHLKEA